MMRFLPINTDPPSLSRYTVLFSKCFPESAKFNPTSLNWLYRQNPDGKVIGFDAWDGERLAAHYACVPARASVGGSVGPEQITFDLLDALVADFGQPTLERFGFRTSEDDV